MSNLARFLIHTCNIERNEPSPDPLGNDEDHWYVPLTDVPIRIIDTTEQVAETERAQQVVISGYIGYVLPGVDIREGDRLTNVVYEDGSTESGYFYVEAAKHHRMLRSAKGEHHLELVLEKRS